jgi:hypothetical protein
MGLSPARL